MKRAQPALLAVLASLVAILASTLSTPARADCTRDIATLRTELSKVKDARRRKELQMLIDKAQKDNEAGRAQLCGQATERALMLLKG